ncbi:MAG: hypothetical protein J4O03_16965 [Chloroflexi bacterium]|nr:hypothetical protein [Chloroflexota bacterium]MCI0795156.1 hypothetical protein [Chloroflexota bacterium]
MKKLTESAGDIQFGEVPEVESNGLAGPNRVYQVAADDSSPDRPGIGEGAGGGQQRKV